jgi:hypothetical protein
MFRAERAAALQERSAPVTDDGELPAVADEPSQEDFEAVDEDEPQGGVKVVLLRVVKVVAVLLVIVALILYFAVPFSVVAFHYWRRPEPRVRTIPLAPEHRSSHKVVVSQAASCGVLPVIE